MFRPLALKMMSRDVRDYRVRHLSGSPFPVFDFISGLFGALFSVLGILTIVALIVGVVMWATSCSTPNRTHVSVRNDADNASVEISVKNGDGGSSSITVTPRISLEVPISSGSDSLAVPDLIPFEAR